MKLAMLGGSFNPVHFGHLALADEVVCALGYDLLLLVPSFKSPFKAEPEGASATDRLAMLNAAVEGHRRIAVDDSELRRGGASYTIDTLEDLQKRYQPEGRIGLVLGDDLARGFPAWKHAEELASLADIIVGQREGSEAAPFPFPHKALSNERMEVSSSEIRRRIASAEAWHFLVPNSTVDIIEERGLYGLDCESPLRGSIKEVERFVRLSVDEERYVHSRGVALCAARLASRFGLDSDAAYLAGIAHDMCKSMDHKTLRKLANLDGHTLSSLEKEKPSLLHSHAAVVLLKKDFAIQDESILEAVRLHTLASPLMGALAKIIYIADKIEASREDVSPALRILERTSDLQTIFVAVLRANIAYLQSVGKTIAKETLDLLKEIDRGAAL